MLNIKESAKNSLKKTREIYKTKYFYSIIIAVSFCLVSLGILYTGSAPSLSQLKEGDISLRTVYAPYEFTYPTTIDEKQTETVKKEFEAKVLSVYDIESSQEEASFTRIGEIFKSLRGVQKMSSLNEKEKLGILKTKIPLKLSSKELSTLLNTNTKDVEKNENLAKDTLENVYLVGIFGIEEKKKLIGAKTKEITIRNPNFKIERNVNVKDLVDEKEARDIAKDNMERLVPKNKALRIALFDIIKNEIHINTIYNENETNQRKESARSQVPSVYNRETVKKNELIVEKGKKLTKDDIIKLTQITRLHAVVNRTSYLSGLLIILLGLLVVAAFYLFISSRNSIEQPKNVLLICINAFLAILASLVIVQSQQSFYLIPLAAIGMILVFLLNSSTAFITTVVLSVYIGFLAGGRADLIFMLLMGSFVGIYAVRGARRRSQIFLAGFIVAAVNFISIVGIGLFNNMEKEVIMRIGILGIVNGIISSFVVIGLLPVFEYTFNLFTNITLLELSDLSHPLLKELTLKAPGTYHHSIMVGDLAEKACDSIGANSLLARVGAYYHDVGKIEKAEYFVENELGSASKHEKLAPSMSALIITNHTKDGVELARKYKLNSAVVDFVSQHHGTSLIYYFYQRALEKVKSETELKEEEFRYPGPKPQTKETAIVLLADSVEASSRILSDPTPARIRGLVQKIINNKFIDGQLDECDLTLKDLNKISESFVRVLTGVFHTRLEYPEAKPKKEKANAGKNKNKQSQ